MMKLEYAESKGMDDIDQALFAILVEHDIAIAERNSQRTTQMWPDLSDIHTNTRRRIREVFELSGEELDAWLEGMRNS